MVSKTMKYAMRNRLIKVADFIVVENEDLKEEKHQGNLYFFGKVVFQVVNDIENDECLLDGWL